MDALEFLERIKVIALYFNSLSDIEIKAIKNWIKNTIVDPLAESAIKILEAEKGDVEVMVARNAFILDEWKEKAKEEGKEIGKEIGEKQGIELTKKVFKLSNAGYSKSEIAKECGIPDSKVDEILE